MGTQARTDGVLRPQPLEIQGIERVDVAVGDVALSALDLHGVRRMNESAN